MPARFLNNLYASLLKLYPDRFADEFGREMAEVFSRRLTGLEADNPRSAGRRVKMTRLFLRELWDFPHSYLAARRYQSSSGAGETSAGGASFGPGQGTAAWTDRPASWPDVLLGALPFVLHGLVYLIQGIIELRGEPGLAFSLRVYIPALLVLMISVSLGLLFGVLRDFPRWSYAYLGMTVYFGWFSSRLWGWLPLSVPILLGMLMRRSRQPLTTLFKGVWKDWSRLSFAIYAFALPLLTVLFMDESSWGIPQLLWLIFDTALLAAGAAVFLRARTIQVRILSLEAPLLVFVVKGGLQGDWWHGSFWQLLGYFTMYAMFLLVPAAIGALRQISIDSRAPADI